MKARGLLSFPLDAVVLLGPSALAEVQGWGRMQGQDFPTRGAAHSGARLRLRGNQHQRCVQALRQARERIRAMAQLASTNAVDLEAAPDMQEQLAHDLQAGRQEQQPFTSSQTEEQKKQYQSRQLEKLESSENLESLSETLGFELEQTCVERGQIVDRGRQLEETSRTREKQQLHLTEIADINQ